MKHAITQIKRHYLLLVGVVLLASCSRFAASQVNASRDYEQFEGWQLAPLKTVEECKELLATTPTLGGGGFDSSNIQILNWNIKKGEESNWAEDLDRLAIGKHLILLQEAALSMELPSHTLRAPFAAFSPGYVTDNDVTGVVTFSGVEPMSHCRLGAIEPWLGTPKSTNVTQYSLSNSDESLVVVNIHAVNFSFGLVSYRAQLEAVVDVLSVHEGPVIFSGDFNTWRKGRFDALMQAVDALGLQPVAFGDDFRKTVFGRPLDHVFVGGLEIDRSSVHEVQSSDHNPMIVSFSLRQPDLSASNIEP